MKTFASVLSALLVIVGLYITLVNINFAGVPLIIVGGLAFIILNFTTIGYKPTKTNKPKQPDTNNTVLTLLGIGITLAIIAAVAYSPNAECMAFCR